METVMEIRFTRMQNMGPDFGIAENLCWPSTLVNDPGYALLRDDPWYRQGNNRGANTQYYDKEPLARFTDGKINQYTWGWTSPYTSGNSNSSPNPDSDGDTEMPDVPDDEDPSFPGGRRSLEDLETFKRSPNELVIHEGKFYARAYQRGLFDDLGLLKCEDQHCQREMGELGFASLPVAHETAMIPAVAEAFATAVTTDSSTEPSGSEFALDVPAKASDAVKSVITPALKHPHYHHRHHRM
jgi:chitinase